MGKATIRAEKCTAWQLFGDDISHSIGRIIEPRLSPPPRGRQHHHQQAPISFNDFNKQTSIFQAMIVRNDDELALLIATLPSSLLIGAAGNFEGHLKSQFRLCGHSKKEEEEAKRQQSSKVHGSRKKRGQRRMDGAFAVLTLPDGGKVFLDGGPSGVAPVKTRREWWLRRSIVLGPHEDEG